MKSKVLVWLSLWLVMSIGLMMTGCQQEASADRACSGGRRAGGADLRVDSEGAEQSRLRDRA